MRNPFRTEAEAFRFVWLTIIYFALIVIASLINTWLGLGVFIGETAILVWWIITRGRHEQPIPQVAPGPHRGRAPDPRGRERDGRGRGAPDDDPAALRGRAATQVLVVCPALNSPLKHWVSDEDKARVAAQGRLEASLATMRDAGIDARGEIGDGDPLPGDRGRDPHVRSRRADHLDASRGPLELARARHRRGDARPVCDPGDPRGRRSLDRAARKRRGVDRRRLPCCGGEATTEAVRRRTRSPQGAGRSRARAQAHPELSCRSRRRPWRARRTASRPRRRPPR